MRHAALLICVLLATFCVNGTSILAEEEQGERGVTTFESPDPDAQGRFGRSVSGGGGWNGVGSWNHYGDWDNDGTPDIVVGAIWETSAESQSGRAYVFPGDGGSEIAELESPTPCEDGHFGRSVSWAGDIDGDGIDDVIVGCGSPELGTHLKSTS